MIFKLQIGAWRYTFTLSHVTHVIGVNSTLPDGKHIVMWDFDDKDIFMVQQVLEIVQNDCELPNIYILNTGKLDHYIAYCFKAMPWRESVQIVACTLGVDPNFFKYGVYREHWTLRVSPKEGRKPQLITTLKSSIPEDCTISELNSWVKDAKHVLSPYLAIHQTCLPREKQVYSSTSCPLSTSAQNTKHSLTQHQEEGSS